MSDTLNDDVVDDRVDDAFVLMRWMSELTAPSPDPVVIASLEDAAEDRGWHPYDALTALTAGFFDKAKKALGGFNPDLHPRGKDGQFIESGGNVRLEGQIDTPGGKKIDATGMRGQVDAIIPDPDSPGRPTIRVRVTSPDGKKTAVVDVKPEQVTAAPEKARLDKPAPDPDREGLAGRTIGKGIDKFLDAAERSGLAKENRENAKARGEAAKEFEAGQAEKYRTVTPKAGDMAQPGDTLTYRHRSGNEFDVEVIGKQPDGGYLVRAPGSTDTKGFPLDEDVVAVNGQPAIWTHDRASGGFTLAPGPAMETPKERSKAAEEVKGATDEELERQATLGPEVWQQAVAQEKENRLRRRAQEAERRQALINTVNEQAANLSTTDAEARAEGLDQILAKLRFSIIDTDKLHDHIYPPGESGRWTPERTAQHEQMWADLLSQVETAGVPQDHDALVLGGLPGAGKSYMLKPGETAASFGVVSWEPNSDLPEGVTHVSINPDIVKEMLIARGMLPEGISPDLKPMEQVTFLHEESSYVAKMFSQRLGDLGYNVVLDNTMDSEGGMLKRMTPLARQGYKFRGLFADIPTDESLASARKRYIDSALTPMGGRFVPSSVNGNRASHKGNMSKNRDAMDGLIAQDWFTDYMIVDNTGVSQRKPKGTVTAQGTGGGTAADRYLPGADAALPKQGPAAPEPAGEPAPAAPAAPAI